MFAIMLAILLAVGSAMPKKLIPYPNSSTVTTQDGGGDGTHVPPGTPPPPPPTKEP
jgi:hypothetical protein